MFTQWSPRSKCILMLLGHGHSQHKYPWYLSVSAQSFLTVKVSVRSSAEKTRDCAAGEKCVSDGCGRVCSPAPQASEAERPARIPQLHRRMLGPAQPSNCLTYTHPNSSNSYLILSSLSTYYPLPCVLSLFSRVPLCAILCTVTWYLNGLVVFPTFFNLSLYLTIISLDSLYLVLLMVPGSRCLFLSPRLGQLSAIVLCCAKLLQLCPTLCDPVDHSPQAPLSMGFSRQEYRCGLPCTCPGKDHWEAFGPSFLKYSLRLFISLLS